MGTQVDSQRVGPQQKPGRTGGPPATVPCVGGTGPCMEGILQGPMNSIILASVCTKLCQARGGGRGGELGERKLFPAFRINKKHKHRQDLGWPGTVPELEVDLGPQ